MADRWIQVVGVFDTENAKGEISGVQPALPAYTPTAPKTSELSLAVLDGDDNVLFETPVEPELGSCDDVVNLATFQGFVDAPPKARAISLRLKGKEISRLVSNPAFNASGESFGFGPQRDHTVPVISVNQPDPNATYTLQAREKGDPVWQTLDVGLAQPDATSVDINQFPGAKAIEVRFLKSQGFDSVEVSRKEIDFEK